MQLRSGVYPPNRWFATPNIEKANASTATPASAGGWTNGERCNVVVINLGEMKKEGSNSAPNSSVNSPTNTTDVKPVITPAAAP